MIYIVLVALTFVFAAMSAKLAGKRTDVLEERIFQIEEMLEDQVKAATKSVANDDVADDNTVNGGMKDEYTG